MADSILEGDVVFTWKPMSSAATYQKGEIVLFKKEIDGKVTSFIKRIVAEPSDTLFFDLKGLKIGKKIYPHDEVYYFFTSVNTQEEPDVSYLNYVTTQSDKCRSYNTNLVSNGLDHSGLTVPKSCFFLIGDNYYESMDSRFWGFIHESQVLGKVIAKY